MVRKNPQTDDVDDDLVREELVTRFRLENVAEDMQDEVLDRASEILFENTLIRAYRALDLVGREKLKDLMDGTNTEFADIMEFLFNEVPDFNTIYQEEGKRIEEALQEA
jgi:hypothetical protein